MENVMITKNRIDFRTLAVASFAYAGLLMVQAHANITDGKNNTNEADTQPGLADEPQPGVVSNTPTGRSSEKHTGLDTHGGIVPQDNPPE
jgi:hypothetical protein